MNYFLSLHNILISAVIIPILKMQKLKFKEMMQFSQDYIAEKRELGFPEICQNPEPKLLSTILMLPFLKERSKFSFEYLQKASLKILCKSHFQAKKAFSAYCGKSCYLF